MARGRSLLRRKLHAIHSWRSPGRLSPRRDAFLRGLLDSNESAAWLTDSQFRFLAGNSAFKRQLTTALGRAPEVGECLLELPFEESLLAEWRRTYEQAFAGKTIIVESPLRLQPEARDFEYRLHPVRDGNGQIYCVAVFSRDVTELKRTQKEAQLHSHILQNLLEGVSLVDGASARIVFANPAFEQMFGYGPGELIGKHVSILNSDREEDPALRARRILDQLEAKGYWSDRIWNVRKDGTRFLSQASVSGLVHPQFGKVWLSKHVDITSHHATEQALRESELRFGAILEHAPILISAKDPEGTLLFVNRCFELIASGASQTWVGRNVFDLFPKDVATVLWANDLAVLASREPVRAEETVQHADGSWHTYQTVKFPLFGENGRAFAVAAISVDITERLQAERERRVLQEKMMEAQRLESLGVLAGGIAHDINNLLVPVLGNARLLQCMNRESVGAEELLEQIETSARHCRDLVQQILAFAGKGRIVTQAVKLDRLLEELIPFLRASTDKNVRLERCLESDLPSVDGEPAQLRQILVNLIINAAEALAGRAGLVEVRIRRWSKDEGPPLGSTVDGGVVLEVRDNGPGIPKEIIDRIFDPFFTTKATGRGLGLSAVLGIVRSHGGTLVVDSEPGKGTTFRIAFPAGQVHEEPPAADPIVRTSPGTKTVLVVDDEPTVRETAVLLLSHLGYQSVGAASGEDALIRLMNSPTEIDCVLLDLTMPGLSGVETLQHLHELAPKLPVIIMSGYNASEALSAHQLAQVSGVLSKPFLPEDLGALLDEVFAREKVGVRRP